MSSPKKLTTLSPAKLNLFLHVLGRRDDGYHLLQTAFQLLDWGDDITVENRDEAGVVLATPMPGIREQDNLIIRAANAIRPPEKGATISIHKRLPMGGGLGGGSSNAATTLRLLNALWHLELSIDELADLGLTLGADVPVFVRGRSAWAEGVGETLTPMELPERWFVVLAPNCHVSTAEIFSAPELTRNTPAIKMSAFFAGGARNDLQDVVIERHPDVRRALNLLNKFSPAMMTGSGACVFAAVNTEDEARRIADAIAPEYTVFVARGIDQTPAMATH